MKLTKISPDVPEKGWNTLKIHFFWPGCNLYSQFDLYQTLYMILSTFWLILYFTMQHHLQCSIRIFLTKKHDSVRVSECRCLLKMTLFVDGDFDWRTFCHNKQTSAKTKQFNLLSLDSLCKAYILRQREDYKDLW